MKLKIGYFADGIWSHEAFKKIILDKEISVEFICVRNDTNDQTLLKFSEKYGIPYLKHANINSDEFISKVKEYECDLFVSMSFNQIFKERILNLPRFKIINCHAGKLPFYRGRNILNWALINDEKEFGITVHYVDLGIDTGNIILQRCYEITDADDYSTLLNRAHIECANVLYDALILFKNGLPEEREQNEIHPVGFYCSQRKEGDEVLDWNQTSREVFNFVRAICKPGPIARSYLNGIEMKINRVVEVKDAPTYKCVVGAILKREANVFFVKTKDGFVMVDDFDYPENIKVGDRLYVK